MDMSNIKELLIAMEGVASPEQIQTLNERERLIDIVDQDYISGVGDQLDLCALRFERTSA